MKNFKIKSYAKVNLLLKIIGKNAKNYHELEMLTALTSTYDVMYFKENTKGRDRITSITLGEHVPKFEFDKENNSIILALNLVRKKFNIPNFFDIEVKKNIPAGGGLGGGSSNAAYILIHFAKTNNVNPASAYEPFEIEEISSDIFCFINEYPLIYQTGIGDKVSKVNFTQDKKLIKAILFFPTIGFSTVNMYKTFSSSYEYSKTGKEITNINLDELLETIDNDFLKVVKDLYPNEYNFYLELKGLNIGQVTMSGSGSTFIMMPNEPNFDMKQLNKLIEKYCISYLNTEIRLK